MSFIKKYPLALIGLIAGAIGGYLYYHYVGCSSGGCAITSKPVNSTIYGAMMGGLFLTIFQKTKKKNNDT